MIQGCLGRRERWWQGRIQQCLDLSLHDQPWRRVSQAWSCAAHVCKAVVGCLRLGREHPVHRSKLCCRCYSSSSQVASSQGRVFFSCLPGQGINCPTLVVSWEGKMGAALLEACPAPVTCPGIRARPPPEAIRHPSCMDWRGPWVPVGRPSCCSTAALVAFPPSVQLCVFGNWCSTLVWEFIAG